MTRPIFFCDKTLKLYNQLNVNSCINVSDNTVSSSDHGFLKVHTQHYYDHHLFRNGGGGGVGDTKMTGSHKGSQKGVTGCL